MNIGYHVELSEAEQCELTALVGGGKHYARKIRRARLRSPPTAGSPTQICAAAAGCRRPRPFTGPSAASLKVISKPP